MMTFATILMAATVAGGADTGGADNRAMDYEVAWFLGDATIHYCLDLSPTFGVDAAAAEKAVNEAAATWAQYVKDRGIYPRQEPDNGLRLATSVVRQAACDGTEDLRIALGVDDAEIQAAKASYENPTSFAFRKSYDMKAGWGKGLIWIAPPRSVFPGAEFPDWTKPCTLRGALLHEWGHVLGTGHVEGTIMAGDMTWKMQLVDRDPAGACHMLSQIDDRRELMMSLEPDYSGTVWEGNEPHSAKMFKLLTGATPVGAVTTRFRLVPLQGFEYTIADARGSHVFPITLLKAFPSQFSSGERVFKVAKGNSTNSGAISVSLGSTGHVQHGHITTSDGAQRLVLVERNAESLVTGPITLELLDGDTFLPIFSTKWR